MSRAQFTVAFYPLMKRQQPRKVRQFTYFSRNNERSFYSLRQRRESSNLHGKGFPVGGGGKDSHIEREGMLIVSLRGVNFGFWSHLGCSGQNAIMCSREGLV